jgi:hypothetical protein
MTIAKNALFTDLSAEESTQVNGGITSSYVQYSETQSSSTNGQTTNTGSGYTIINGVVVDQYSYTK